MYTQDMKKFLIFMVLAIGCSAPADILSDINNATRAQVAKQTLVQDSSAYSWYKIEFNNTTVGAWNIFLKKSKQSPRPRPVVFVATGIKTGFETLKLFNQDDDIHVVVFEYAFDKNEKDERLVASLLQNALKMQTQMAMTLKWISQQDFVREDRINVLLVSFSTFISPMALRLAQQWNVSIYSTVFAFGGAQIKNFTASFFKNCPQAQELQKSADAFLDWMDPENHLPYLKSQFLVIRGEFDNIIPLASSLALEAKVPEPKKIVVLPTVHIDMERPDIVRLTMATVQEWYTQIQAL